MVITKSDVLDAIQKLRYAAKMGTHESLLPFDPPDSAYNIHAVLGSGSLDAIQQFRDEIFAEMFTCSRRMPVKIPVNPKLPKNFNDIRNEDRPKSHHRWWYRPFIIADTLQSEVRFFVCCLDGGAWDRTTFHGVYPTLEEAMTAAKSLAEKYEPYRQYCKALYPARLSGGYHLHIRCCSGGSAGMMKWLTLNKSKGGMGG